MEVLIQQIDPHGTGHITFSMFRAGIETFLSSEKGREGGRGRGRGGGRGEGGRGGEGCGGGKRREGGRGRLGQGYDGQVGKREVHVLICPSRAHSQSLHQPELSLH